MNTQAWRKNFVTLWTGQFIAIAGLTVMVPLLPFYIEELAGKSGSTNYWWMGLCLAAPAITMFIFSPIWGSIGDRWGRKWMVVRALAGLTICLILMVFAQTPWQLFLCRLLQGAFGGVVDSSASFISAEAPPEKNGKALGSLHSATAAGSFVGPLIGGVLADICGYHVLFIVMAILTGISSCVAAWQLTETHKPNKKSQANKNLIIKDAVLSLFQAKETRAFILAGICVQSGIYGLTVIFAPYIDSMVGENQHSATWVGILQAVTWLSTMLASPWWGKQNDSKPVRFNFFLAALGCGISIYLQAMVPSILWLIPLRMIQGLCFAALLPSVLYQVSQYSNDQNRSTKIGLTNSCLVGGQIIGSLLGAGLNSLVSLSAVLVIMGSLFLLGACLVVMNREMGLKVKRYPFTSQ